MAKMGRQSSFTKEAADELCNRMAHDEFCADICKDDHMPNLWTASTWRSSHPDFAPAYARARVFQADSYAREAYKIALNAKDAQLGRLAYDAGKWLASKLAPADWGDKVNLNGADGTSPPVTRVEYSWAPPPLPVVEILKAVKRLSQPEPPGRRSSPLVSLRSSPGRSRRRFTWRTGRRRRPGSSCWPRV